MEGAPPPYANYPRNDAALAYGSSGQLQSLMDAYYGYSKLFLAQIVMALVWIGLIFLAGENGGYVYAGGIPVLMVTIGILSFPLNKKVGFGAGWSQSQVILASVMMAFTVICYGIIGYVVMQTIAANHIKKYGIRSGCLGLRKKVIREKIAELQQAGR